jgi:hypothetical protein
MFFMQRLLLPTTAVGGLLANNRTAVFPTARLEHMIFYQLSTAPVPSTI